MSDLSKIDAGSPVAIVTTYKFPENNIACEVFPDGITPEHVLIATDKVSVGRVTVTIPGVWVIADRPDFIQWVNPMFRIPSWYFDKALVKPNG